VAGFFRFACVMALVSRFSPAVAGAQTFNPTMTILHNFANEGIPSGLGPRGALVQANDLNFYGMTLGGGTSGLGTLFRMTPDGAVTILHSFAGGEDGAEPSAGLIQGRDRFLYGTTLRGGSANQGTLFRASLDGAVTVLHSFEGGNDGAEPSASLVEARDGNFYSTTTRGGTAGTGTIFEMTPDGAITTLHSFERGPLGFDVNPSGLTQAVDDSFYGTTRRGGTADFGTVFRMADGAVTILHSFPGGLSGAHPVGGVTQAIDGNFYGAVTFLTGLQLHSSGVYRVGLGGVVSFALPSGQIIGQEVSGGLVATNDGFLWGVVRGSAGGDSNGYLFAIHFSGSPYADTRRMDQPIDGGVLVNTLVQGRDGNLYGTGAGLSSSAFRLIYFWRCMDKLTVSYEGTTLNLGFTVGAVAPGIWSAWLAVSGPPEESVLLWQAEIPMIRPAVFVNLAVPNFPPIGPLFVITNLILPPGSPVPQGRACADWKLIDTGP
jgi:uncharacterized repeat protein (TIGR03803 family)